MAGLDRRRDVDDFEAGTFEHLWQSSSNAGIAALRCEEGGVGGHECRPFARTRNHRQRLAAVVFDRQDTAWLERGHQLAQVALGMGEKQEHPSREDQVVGRARKRRVRQHRLPRCTETELVACGQLMQTTTEGGGWLYGIDRSTDAFPQLDVQRSLTRPDLEDAPATLDADAIEEGERRQTILCSI